MKLRAPGSVTLNSARFCAEALVPIPGTTRQHRMEENIGAVNVRLGASELDDIDRELAKIRLTGERLPEAALKMTGL